MHEVLVNRLGGLSLPRKSVVRLTDRPDMILDVYRGRKTTNQQQLTADLFLFCLERDFMVSLYDDKQAEIVQALNSTYYYPDDLSKEGVVHLIYQTTVQLELCLCIMLIPKPYLSIL